jgi:hypothetical protein
MLFNDFQTQIDYIKHPKKIAKIYFIVCLLAFKWQIDKVTQQLNNLTQEQNHIVSFSPLICIYISCMENKLIESHL